MAAHQPSFTSKTLLLKNKRFSISIKQHHEAARFWQSVHIFNRRHCVTFVFIQWIPQELGWNHGTLKEKCFSFPDAPFRKETFTLKKSQPRQNAPLPCAKDACSPMHPHGVPAEEHKCLQKLTDQIKNNTHNVVRSTGEKLRLQWLMLDCISRWLLTIASCQPEWPAPR